MREINSGKKIGESKLEDHQKAENSQSLSGLQCANSGNKGVETKGYLKHIREGHSFTYQDSLSLHIKGYNIHQVDSKNMFLKGDLEETVYLPPQPGLAIPEGHCLLLKKETHGLKQAPCVWYAVLKAFFKSISFSSSPSDPCFFVSRVAGWECFFHVYFVDMMISGKQRPSWNHNHHTQSEVKVHTLPCYVQGALFYLATKCVHVAIDFGLVNHTKMVANNQLCKANPLDHEDFLKLQVNYRRDLPGVSPTWGLSSASAPLYIPQLAIYHPNHNIRSSPDVEILEGESPKG
ncbi:uncharacterized protein VP01_2730g2 [Puccinia sorghi]|uniref:Reverse transcriptase Ty1/copia-type domain-containing protein n=1 Tax=Puccinia sorghi TaxID=27349 RepID=A0A0L6V380_9BASI|nr:uncharacterized protein VP01_2730g2 [Puccinia sorghi]